MPDRKEHIKVEELLNLDVLQTLQDGFAELTGMTVLICRRDGKILTHPSLGNKLSRIICKRPEGKKNLIEAALSAARVAQDNNKTITNISFAGMPLIASPIIVEGQRLATIVVASNPRYCFYETSEETVAKITGLAPEVVKDALRKTPNIAPRQMDASISLLHSIATTLAESSSREYQLRQRISELTIMHSIASLFAGRADLREILRITANQVIKLANARACSIRVYNARTKELRITAVANLSEDYLRKGPLKLKDSPIDREALSGKPVYIRNMQTDPRVVYKEQAAREGLVSGLAVGMIYRGRAVGVIHLYTDKERTFEKTEIETIKAIASQAASAVINARLFREALEAERMQRQLKMAAEVQRRMVPKEPPKFEEIEIGSIYEPTYLVGGDFYDFIELSDNRLAVAIADVAGKGVPASLQMASLRSTLRAYADRSESLSELIQQTDVAFRRDCMLGEFATLLFGIINPNEETFTYINAGHNPAMFIRGGKIEHLQVTAPALAVFENPEFKEELVNLSAGDKIVLYTDGMIDAMNFNQETFGLERFEASIKQHIDLPPKQAVKNILWDLRRFTGLATQSDDLTLVIIAYKPDNK